MKRLLLVLLVPVGAAAYGQNYIDLPNNLGHTNINRAVGPFQVNGSVRLLNYIPTNSANYLTVNAQGYVELATGGGGGGGAIVAVAPLAASTIGATTTLSMPVATGSVSGYLGMGDWNTFNNKMPKSDTGVYVATRWWVTTLLQSLTSFSVAGTVFARNFEATGSGFLNGYIALDSNGASPAAEVGKIKLFMGSAGNFGLKGSTGFNQFFVITRLTGNRSAMMPDRSFKLDSLTTATEMGNGYAKGVGGLMTFNASVPVSDLGASGTPGSGTWLNGSGAWLGLPDQRVFSFNGVGGVLSSSPVLVATYVASFPFMLSGTWRLNVVDPSPAGTVSVTLKKNGAAITGGTQPAISSSGTSASGAYTSWSAVSFAAGDVLTAEITSCAGITNLLLTLQAVKN